MSRKLHKIRANKESKSKKQNLLKKSTNTRLHKKRKENNGFLWMNVLVSNGHGMTMKEK